MASTIKNATMKVTITETLILNGKDQGSTNTFQINEINEIYKRIVSCTKDVDTTIATFRTTSSTADAAIDLEDARYIRVTNLDDTNSVNLSLQIAGGEDATPNMSSTILLEAGKTFLMGSPHDGIATSDADATIVTSLNDLESILIDPGANTVDIEIFVASV